MKQMQELMKLDVTRSMSRNISVLMDAISTVNAKNVAEARERLETIDSKVAEIEEYFWRPVDSTEVYEKLTALARALGDERRAETYRSKIDLFKANELEIKGRVQDFFGNKTKASQYYAEALKFVPDHELARPACGKVLKSVEKAKSDLAKTGERLQSSPDDPKLHFKRGMALLALGEVEKALEHLDRAIALDPSDPEALARRGTAMESLGDFEGAIGYLQKALEVKPSSLIAKRGKNYARYYLEHKNETE